MNLDEKIAELKLKFDIDYPERTLSNEDVSLLKNTFDMIDLV